MIRAKAIDSPAPSESSGLQASLPELLALRARALELVAGYRRRSASREAGPSHSVFRGRGMDYAESRPYTPGDDVRHIDWRVTARTGRAHSKVFQAERDRVTALVVDRSAAMPFGTRGCFKSVQAARLGALLAWAGSIEGDRLAAISRGESLPALRGRRGVLQLMNALSRWSAADTLDASPTKPASDYRQLLERLPRLIRPGSHVLLLLDARSVDADSEPALRALAAHNDVIAAMICDPLEMAAPPSASYLAARDGDSCRLALDSSSAREAWSAHFDQLQNSALGHLSRAGVGAMRVATTDDPLIALRDLLRGVRTLGCAA